MNIEQKIFILATDSTRLMCLLRITVGKFFIGATHSI